MEAPAVMSTEIVILGWAIILLLVQLVAQTLAGVSDLGLGYAMSARDEGRQPKSVIAGRLTRAFHNLLETFVVFAALALALAVTGKTGGLGATGALVWFWARIVYVPVYAFGIPILRTLVWAVSVVGLVLMLIALFF